MDKHSEIERAVAFFRQVGIPVEERAQAEFDAIIAGVWVAKGGGIAVHAESLAFVDDLYHEAGHVAVVPKLLWEHLEEGQRFVDLRRRHTIRMCRS